MLGVKGSRGRGGRDVEGNARLERKITNGLKRLQMMSDCWDEANPKDESLDKPDAIWMLKCLKFRHLFRYQLDLPHCKPNPRVFVMARLPLFQLPDLAVVFGVLHSTPIYFLVIFFWFCFFGGEFFSCNCVDCNNVIFVKETFTLRVRWEWNPKMRKLNGGRKENRKRKKRKWKKMENY